MERKLENIKAVIDKIEADPTCWNQRDWHRGTSYCFAGHAQIMMGLTPNNETVRRDARIFFGFNKTEADYYFHGCRTLDELKTALNVRYDREGYDCEGYDREGYDREGFNRGGYDRGGYDREGFNRGGYDRGGYDREGYDIDGYDRGGYDREGYDIDGYDCDGYDCDGYDCDGLDKDNNINPILI